MVAPQGCRIGQATFGGAADAKVIREACGASWGRESRAVGRTRRRSGISEVAGGLE